MIELILESAQEEMKSTIEAYKQHLKQIRT